MTLDLARARVMLAREVAALETTLEGEAAWLALRAYEARTGERVPHRLGAMPISGIPHDLLKTLSRHPAFQARASLLDALDPLCEDEAATQPEDYEEGAAPMTAAERIEAALAALVAEARELPMPNVALRRPAPETEFPPRSPGLIPVVDENGDDLRHIRFIDDEIAAKLKSTGILKFSDIAHLTVEQVGLISVRFGLGNRISREQWIEQATVLASGRQTAYSRGLLGEEQAALPAADEAPTTAASANVPPPIPASAEDAADIAAAEPAAEPVLPPPLPEHALKAALQADDDEEDDALYAEDDDDHFDAPPTVRIVRRRPGRAPADRTGLPRGIQWHYGEDDGPLLSSPPRREPVEEADVEIVARPAPFPGVGPVQEAASRLQSAVSNPQSSFSAFLKTLRGM